MSGLRHRFHAGLLITFMAIVALLSGCGGGSSSNNTVTATSLTISPQLAQLAKGTSQEFTATLRFSDGSTQNVSELANWTSAEPTIASIATNEDQAGTATGLAVGKTTITASYQDFSASTSSDGVEVTSAVITAIQLSPQDASVAKGLTRQYTATGIFSDGSNQDVSATAQWVSSQNTIATVSASGLASSHTVGETIISVQQSGFSDNSTLTVSAASLQTIQVSPTSVSLANGLSQQFVATGSYSDGSQVDISSNASWSSADATRIAIDTSGLATAKNTGGPINITTSLNGIDGLATATISDAVVTGISLSPAVASIPKGRSQQFIATGSYSDGSTANISANTEWLSDDTSVVAVDGNGLASALKVGDDITISAKYNDFETSSTMSVTDAVLDSIEVSPSDTTIPDGTYQQYTATGNYSDNAHLDITTAVTWLSSDRDIADISNVSGNQGYAIGRDPGTVEISANLGSVTGKTELTVSSAELRAIQVTPNNKTLANGFSRQFTATGFYTDGSSKQINDTASWQSSHPNIASVSNNIDSAGLVSAVDAGDDTSGTVSIRAAIDDISGFASLTVNNASLQSILVSPVNPSIALDPDTRLPFSAQGTFSDSSQLEISKQVQWSSSNELVATVSNIEGAIGIATPVAVGSSEISATRQTIVGTTTLNITDAVLEEITVTPPNATVAAGVAQQYTATGRYSDDSTQNISQNVSWASDDSSVEVSNAAETAGLASTSTEAAGKVVKITASMNSISSNAAELAVTAATLTSIDIDTNPANITATPAGTEVQFIATGTYTDGSTGDLSQTTNWSVIEETPAEAEANVGDISNEDSNKGLLSTFSPGMINIAASSGSITAERELNVTDAVLSSLSISPSSVAIPLNTQQQFTATAHYSDGSETEVTGDEAASWSSNETTIATVDNGSQKGLAISQGQSGLATIAASFQGQTAQASLTVNPALLVSISLENLDSLPVGAKRQLIATGHYDDSSTQDISQQVTWSSFSGFAIISNADDSRGMATGIAKGSEVVSASLDGITVSAELQVSEAVLDRIEISPANETRDNNTSIQYTATGIYTDSSTIDMSSSVTWASSDTNVATISNAAGQKGLAQTKFQFFENETQISAFDAATNITGTTTLTVTAF